MSFVSRQFHFDDFTWEKDRATGSKVEAEIGGVADFINNLSRGTVQLQHLVFKFPDGKLFELVPVYESDGVTPTLQLQRVTFP